MTGRAEAKAAEAAAVCVAESLQLSCWPIPAMKNNFFFHDTLAYFSQSNQRKLSCTS